LFGLVWDVRWSVPPGRRARAATGTVSTVESSFSFSLGFDGVASAGHDGSHFPNFLSIGAAKAEAERGLDVRRQWLTQLANDDPSWATVQY
jgi:hypothetical protein